MISFFKFIHSFKYNRWLAYLSAKKVSVDAVKIAYRGALNDWKGCGPFFKAKRLSVYISFDCCYLWHRTEYYWHGRLDWDYHSLAGKYVREVCKPLYVSTRVLSAVKTTKPLLILSALLMRHSLSNYYE